MNRPFLYTSFVLFLGITSCKFYEDESKIEDSIDVNQRQLNCELNSQELKKILDKEIEKDLDCLEDNLVQFSDFVKLQKPGEIKRSELELFIRKFFSGDSDDLVKSLKIGYDLKHFILGGEQRSLKIENITSLVDIFRTFNKHGTVLNQYFKKESLDYWQDREDIKKSIGLLVTDLKKQTNFQGERKLNLVEFVQDLKEMMSDSQFDADLIEKMLPLKKLFTGGESEELETNQWSSLIDKAPSLIISFLDVVYSFDLDRSKSTRFYEILWTSSQEIHQLMYDLDGNEVVFEMYQLMSLAQDLMTQPYRIEAMLPGIEYVKENLLSSGDWKKRDFDQLFNWIKEGAESVYFHSLSYTLYKKEMESPGPIRDLNPKDSIQNDQYWSLHKSHWDDFKKVAINYRLYRHQDDIPYYTNEYLRARFGIEQISFWRYLSGLALDIFGHENDFNQLSISRDEFREVLNGARTILEELNLWPDDPERFIFEAYSAGDLLQYQANGDEFLQREEIVEYLNNILATQFIVKDMMERFKIYCDHNRIEPKFEVPCFREHFFRIFFEEVRLTPKYANLGSYLLTIHEDERIDFLSNVELSARVIPDDRIPIGETDMSRIIVSLGNLEQLFLRYDLNLDRYFDRSELDVAFSRFERLILGFVPPILHPFKDLIKSIFYYLADKRELPTTFKLMIYHFFNKKNIMASRLDISFILSFFSHTKDELKIYFETNLKALFEDPKLVKDPNYVRIKHNNH